MSFAPATHSSRLPLLRSTIGGNTVRRSAGSVIAPKRPIVQNWRGAKGWQIPPQLAALGLSEVLARNFGAEWTDIAPSELGYWAMTTPSGHRIWPFGRILRFVLQGYKERDLVSYYLELEARVRGVR